MAAVGLEPAGKTSSLLWFSSMITRTFLIGDWFVVAGVVTDNAWDCAE